MNTSSPLDAAVQSTRKYKKEPPHCGGSFFVRDYCPAPRLASLIAKRFLVFGGLLRTFFGLTP
jgi:hypothetical protein